VTKRQTKGGNENVQSTRQAEQQTEHVQEQSTALTVNRKRKHQISLENPTGDKADTNRPKQTSRRQITTKLSAPPTKSTTENWQQQLRTDRAKGFAEQLKNDKSQWAIKPEDPERLEQMCLDFYNSMEGAHAESTVRGDRYHWRFWESYTTELGTPAIRDDIASIIGLDPFGHQREIWLQANAITHWMPHIKGRGGRTQGTPQSCHKRLDGMRRVHERLGLPTVSRKLVTMKVNAAMRQYALEHGPEWLIPQRKNPLPWDSVKAMIILARVPTWASGSWTTEATQSLEALIHTMAETGMRKAEVTASRGFTKLNLSFANLKWMINGDIQEATPQLLRTMVPNRDYAVIYPTCAKADPFSQCWGNKPIFMLYNPAERINAATALRRLELMCDYRVAGKRRQTPLFQNSALKAFTGKELDKVLKEMLRELVSLNLMTTEQASTYSWHSFRTSLATALLASGASGPQIQACCRWLSEKSVPVYAAFTAETYAAMVRKALAQDISTAVRNVRPDGLLMPGGDVIQYDDAPHVRELLDLPDQ
jgi:hypothetical protein